MALRRSLGVMAIPLAEMLITLEAFLQGGCQDLGGAGRAWWLWEWLCEDVLRDADGSGG